MYKQIFKYLVMHLQKGNYLWFGRIYNLYIYIQIISNGCVIKRNRESKSKNWIGREYFESSIRNIKSMYT